MTREEFFSVLSRKMNEPYTVNIIRGIERNMGETFSIDDAISDCYTYFADDKYNRCDRLENENGARVTIERWCKRKYTKTKSADENKDIEHYMSCSEIELLNKFGYSKMDKRLHFYLYHKLEMKNRSHIKSLWCKNPSTNVSEYSYKSKIKVTYNLILKTEFNLGKIINHEERVLIDYYFNESKNPDSIRIGRKKREILNRFIQKSGGLGLSKVNKCISNLYIRIMDVMLSEN